MPTNALLLATLLVTASVLSPVSATEAPRSEAVAASPSADAEARFLALVEREWQWRLAQFPQLATGVGVHDHDDRLGRVDAVAQQERRRYWEGVLAELDRIDIDTLPPARRIDARIFRDQLESNVDNIRLGDWQMPFNADSSFWSGLTFLPRRQPLATADDYRRYIKRLEAVPALFDQYIGVMEAGIARGMTVPRATLGGRDRSIAQLAEGDPEASPFYAPFKRIPAGVPADEADALREAGRRVVAEAVQPAYAKLHVFFRDTYVPNARATLAAHDLPDGEAYYRRQIIDFVTEDLPPGQIHDIGLAEVARIRAAMQAIIDEVEFDGDFAAFLKFLREDPQFYPRTADDLLASAAWTAKRVDGELPKYFGRLPRRPYGIQPVPAEIAPFYTAGRYVPAGASSSEPGWYWVNTHNLRSRPLYTLPALTLHEAVPGHHLQGALAQEQGEQLPFRRHSYISAYGEGWALYAEELGNEMGIYRTPYERFGQLTYAMWRACRLVVDTGIHAKGWTREQALAYMRENTALSEHEITTEVDRYISWPGQALSYMIGMIRIRELRADAERELGAGFDIREFHDTVLATGSVPLPVLEAEVRRWIATKR